jgi:trypsin-like peptidase
MNRCCIVIAAMALLCASISCVSTSGTTNQSAALIYGNDDRVEYFEVSDTEPQARIASAMVALIPKMYLDGAGSKVSLSAAIPSWGAAEGLCPGTRFADQPAAALCTGILVDQDLVLTADHCVRVLPLADLTVVFGYYYRAAGVLTLDETVDIASIVTEELDSSGTTPRLDYAWLRLRGRAPASHLPAPINTQHAPFDVGSPIISIGAGGGIPLKLDSGGRIRDARSDVGDYFLADTDTFGGGSGGGAFDAQMNLLGILARGGTDFMVTDTGCYAVVQQPDGSAADEQFTYASRAVEGLCAKDPTASSLCRADCGNPCTATPPPASDGGCSIAGPSTGTDRVWPWFLLLAPLVARRSRRHHRAGAIR